MQIIKTIKDMQALSKKLRAEGKTIGFVPTMGALHKGHMSLVRRSKNENSSTIVSVFVNPAQFGPKEDFDRYPTDMDGDLNKLSGLMTDAVFIPDSKEMYPEGPVSSENVGHIGEILCGASRPGHFDGVATIVAKLFDAVMPHNAYFGQKDYQQIVVIKKLIKERNFNINVVVCPTVRETDGLAMSSRNSYLNPAERKAAGVLYKALKHGEHHISNGVKDSPQLKIAIEEVIKSEPLVNIDYIEIVNPESLDVMEQVSMPAVICLAVRIGATRLIDNVIVQK